MPSPSKNSKTGKVENHGAKLVRRDTGRDIDTRRKPFSKQERAESSKTITVHENQAIEEEAEYLDDRFEKDEPMEGNKEPGNKDDVDRDMDEYEKKMNEENGEDNEIVRDDDNDTKTEPLRDTSKTQNAKNQDVKRRSISNGRFGNTSDGQAKGKNESKRDAVATKKPNVPLTRYGSYRDAQPKIDTGRDRVARKSLDLRKDKNDLSERRQTKATIEEEQECAENDGLRGYRFNEESESFDLIDYRDEWEESPDTNYVSGLILYCKNRPSSRSM